MEPIQPESSNPAPVGSGDSAKWDGQSWPDQENELKAPKRKRHWIASRTRTAGILIAVWPIIMAFLGSLGSHASMFDESSGSGAAIWLLFMSVPLGLAVAGIGAMVGAVAQSRTSPNKGS
jgi:hypothetical protein